MEEIEKLHEVVVKQGLYTKSLDEFKQKYSDKESIDKLYSVVSEKGLYTKEKDNFYDKYFPSQKKNQVGNGDSTAKETPSVSSSKIQPVTSLGGEKIPTAKASATSTGVKITPFKGFSKEEITQMKKPESVIKQEEKQPLKSVKKAPLYAKQLKLQRELSTAVVTPENQDEIQQKTDELAKIKFESIKSGKKEPDFVDSLVANLDAGLFSFAKAAVKDAPEMAWDLTTTIGATAADILGDETLAAMTKYKADDVAKILGFRNLPAEQLEQSIKRANSVVQEYNDKNGGDALTALSNGNYLGASKMIAGSTMQSLPLMLGAMVTGGGTAALGTISAASAAMKYGELKEQNPELSTESKLASAVASGILEGFVGKFFSGASGAVAKKIILDKGVEEGSKIIAKGFKSMAMNAVEKSPIIGLVGEVAEEGGVEFGNQTIEIANGTRDSYDFKKIGNAGISATGMGITNTVAVYGAKGYIKLSDYNKVKKTNKEIFKLTNELSNPNLTDFDKSLLSQRVDRLVTENKKIVGDGLEKIKALPNEVKSEIVEINNSLDVLKNKVLDLEDNFVLSDDTKSSMIQEIKSNVKELTDRKLKIIEGTYIYDDFNKLSDAEKIDRKDKAGIELLNEAKAKGAEKASFDDAQITKKAVEDYGNERKQRSDREAANKEKPTGDQAVSKYTQPTGEGEKGVRGVQEEVKSIVDTKIKTGLGVSESYSDIESVPEFMKPLAKPGAKGETTINGETKQTQRYSVIATAEELQDAYDNFYGKPTEAKETPDVEVKKDAENKDTEEKINELLNDEDRFQQDYAENKVDYFETADATKKGFEKYKNYLNLTDALKQYFKGGSVIFNGQPSMYLDAERANPISLDEIAELYHKAKADNSNPELVQAVEKGLNSISNIEENSYRNNEYLAKIKQEVSTEVQPTATKGTPDVVSQPIDLTVPKVEIKDKSTDELEKRQAELDEKGFKSFTKESEEFGEIDKELERREWKSVLDSSLEDIPSIVDSLMKKEKEMPNGYGSYMEKKDARETKDVAEKYSKPVTKQESKKDFKDSFFGNPDTWYADGLKMRESVRSFLENGGTFKELLQSVQKEFESDGFSEQEAASVVKSKLDKIKKVNEPIDLGTPKVEVKPTEPTVAEAPIVETPKESKARQTLVDKTKNAEAELKTVLAKNIKSKKTTVKKQPTLTEQLGITKKPAAPKSKTGKASKDEVVPNAVVPVPVEMSVIEESKPTRSVDIVKTSDNGLLHASNFEGIPYEIEGGIGLVQGFSPFGNVVYAPYKGEYRIRTDVSSIDESSKQTMLNKDELARLKELRNNLESQESKNESESKNPFEQQGRVASSDSVPTNVRDFVKEITDSLGITSNIFIITDGDFNESQYKKHGLFGKLASIRSAILSSKDSSEWGHKRAISSANANYIYYGGNLTESQVFSVVAHEVGHIVESELFNNASPETKAKVKADYDAWFAKLNGKTVVEVNKEARDITLHDLISNNTSEFNAGSHGYISSFSEYLADNVGKWVRSSEKPKTLVDKFFSNLAEEFKKIYDYVFKTGNYSKSMFEWLDEQYLSNKKQGGAVSTDASLSKMKGAGESYDPKGNSENQSSINKAILKYAVNKIALGAYDVNAFVKDMASNGVELTKEGADFLFGKSQKAYKTQIEKLTGVSRKPSVGQARQQKVINKSYSVGVATQKIETEAQKQKTKAAKAEIAELKKQFNDVVSAIKTEKDIVKQEALKKQADKLKNKMLDLRQKSKAEKQSIREKSKSEISDLKAQFNDIISAIKTERDIVKKEALQKQADKLNEKIAEVKAKLAESKTEVKDLKGQVRDVFKAAVEAVRQAKANARTDAKAYSDFVAMKQAALADYLAKNLSGKITAKEAASIIKSVSKASDEAIEKVNRLIDKVAKRTEREAKNELKKSIKENLKEGKITSGEGVKNIKVTLSAKRYLLDARKIDLESMDLDQLAQLDRDIADVLATGVASRKAMNEVIKRRRRDIEAEAIVRYERKFKQGVESDNIDMYETLKAKNIVILEDGTVFFPEDYKQTEFMPPQKGTVISENATKQQANKSFLDKSGFPAVAKYVYSKLGEIPKYHFSLTYRFYDLLSDTESQDFFNKNVFDKLEKFRNRVDNRATNYSKSLNDKIYGTQPVNKKLSTLFKSNLFKTARVFAKKEGLSIGGVTLVKKGVTENIEFGQTDLVLEERTGKKENILKGATNSEVINLYNSLRDYKFLTKTFMKGGRFDLNDALKVINYVNQNPELRRRAEALVDTYAEIAVDLSAKMDEIGKNLNVGEYLTEDEYRASSLAKNNGDQAIANAQTAQYMSILRAFYGNNIPKIIPYVPISAEKVSSESSTGSEILDGNGFYNPSLAFPNLLERKGGGNLVLKSYQESFDEYTKNVSRFIEGNDLLSDFTAMFNGDHSKKILTQQFGEQWVKKANDGLVETILENDRSLNSPMSKFISLGAVNVLLFNPTSATSQLSSAPGFLASLNEAERKEYFKIMKDSNKRKEYQSKILNSNYIANRANMSNHEYDAAMLKRLSTEGGMFSFGGLVGDFISDAMILTSLSDAASIVYGGSGLFGVKYEAKLKEYLRTMNRADASKKAEEEAMLDLASASEKTQQSSQVAFVSEFRRNPVLRALGATAFASSSLQAGEMAIKSFRDLKNGRGDKKENIKKVLYFGTLAPTIFTLTAALIRGAFDDDDDPLVKVANDALNTSLEQLTTVGKVVAMVKDYYLEQYAPEAVGLRMKYNTDDNDLIVKYGSDFSPGLGVKVRDIKAAIDSKGKRTIVERGAAGVQAATNVPLKRMVDIGTNWTIAFNSEYANMVRLKGLFLQIPESERFKHREHIESIKKQADDLVRLSPEQSIVASKIKDPIEKKRFVDDALLERKFKFINYRLNEWFKDGYSDSRNAERMQQQDNNAIEDITENYLRDYVDATLSKDKKAVIESLDKLLGRIDYYEKNNSSAHAAIVNKLDSKITEILKEDIEYFASVKKFSSGKPRAVAIYSKIGAMLTEDFESPGTLGMIRVLDSEGLLDDSTVKEYYKYVQEKKREAK